ncbi:MAG: ferritin [Ignavibacteriae bacterium]|nr:ferritin [Ignavibacteriota bacterium]MCB0752136.1 ferritin [Ignavibacteriota bacterium]MCB9208862.1 ferritin [Ignavibacteriales bacterium]MCB9218220.1 ferritin [Ignavibacteriales bacterium]MCB9260721.1 ferritin [Ignavibacteriales bacterium]
MTSSKIIDALNLQLNKEMFSSYLYLSMSAYFDNKNLAGMSQWMKLQSQEEYAHAMKFYDFILRLGGKVKLTSIDDPQTDWDSAQKVFEDSLHHEKFISKSIHELMDLATEEKDHPTKSFLQWFVDEQVEEEDTVQQIVDNFDLIGDSKGGLFMLDRELGSRSAAGEAE